MSLLLTLLLAPQAAAAAKDAAPAAPVKTVEAPVPAKAAEPELPGLAVLDLQIKKGVESSAGEMLNDLILELSEQGHDDLVNELTGIDSEMDQRCGEDEEKLLEHLRGAAKGICRFHEDRAYDQKKKSMAATRTDSELLSLVEQQAASPRPSSIGRSR